MPSYRQRLTDDLDRWIAAGLVPGDNRAAILDSIREGRRLDAAQALAVVGGLLLGVAVIAFVAANWSAIPRLARFGMILAAFVGAATAGAWAHVKGRRTASQLLLAVAALVYAAAIGLTGQIFDIAGDPQTALRAAGLAAALLAAAGASPWAAAVALALIGAGDMARPGAFSDSGWPGWLVAAAPAGAAAALAWRSRPLAHAAGIGLGLAALTVPHLKPEGMLAAAAVLAVLAGLARFLRPRCEGAAVALYGWLAWATLAWFGAAGIDTFRGVGHSIGWLALSAAVVALGRNDRHAGVTGAGVAGLLAAGAMLLFNLGLGLLTSAAVFAVTALAALAAAFLLRRSRPA